MRQKATLEGSFFGHYHYQGVVSGDKRNANDYGTRFFKKVFLDIHPISCYHLGRYFQVDGKLLQEQYREHISEYGSWDHKLHADDWMLFSKNVSTRLSINETALSNGELSIIVTNKDAKGRKVLL